MPEVAVIAAIAGGGVSAYSAIQQGKIAEQTAKFNQAIAGQEAETITESQEFEERETRVEGRKLRARQLLQFASGGVVPTTGTPLLVQRETAADVEKEIGRQRYGFGLQRQQAFSRGTFAKARGKALSRASRFQAGSSLLTGAYRAGSIYS
jgi:hypothetical protein